jgi:hypothetical protein
MSAKELIEFLSSYDEATEVKIVIAQSHQYSIHNFAGADMNAEDNPKEIGIALFVDLTKSKPLFIDQN